MRVVIVGGGCSGSLVAFHLLRKGFRDPLTVIEPRSELGRGLAYSTTFDGHLLNVVAEKMSALPAEPGHFVDWLRARRFPGATPCAFAPRRLYGEYLNELVRDQLAENGHKVRHERAEVTAINQAGSRGRLTLNHGAVIDADKIVLALGNPPTGTHAIQAPPGLEDRWQASPWIDNALELREPDERILLIGAGQTAIDAALAFRSQSADCRIHLLSRSGNLPQKHSLAPWSVPPIEIDPGMGIRQIFRALRGHVQELRRLGMCWQTAVDALRPISNDVWQSLPAAERQRFLRHVKTLWETHRSRLAPAVADRMSHYFHDGSVDVIAGRITGAEPACGGFDVRLALRHGGTQRLEVDRVINCTGIHECYSHKPRPLIRHLLSRGLASANDVGIGFRTDGEGALCGPAVNLLFTLGPPRRGELFETIAVPEIRVQAEALATRLLN